MARAGNNRRKLPAADSRERNALRESESPLGNDGDALLKFGFFPFLLSLVIVFLCLCPVEEYDIWFHMAHARYLLQHHAFPPGDVFSFTSPGREWISTGWLASLILFWLWEVVGGGQSPVGILLYVLVQVLAAYLAAYFVAARRKVHAAMAILLLLALPAACLRFNERPDLCSQLLTSFVLLILVCSETVSLRKLPGRPQDRFAEPVNSTAGDRRLWILPFLILLWANLHAGFMVGVAVVGIYAAHRFIRWMKARNRSDLMALLPCALGLVAWIANPYGVNILKLPSKIKSIPGITTMVFEWMPLYVPGGQNLAAFTLWSLLALLVICGVALIISSTRVPWWHLAIICFFLLITWNARRQIALCAIALPIMTLPHLGELNRRLTRYRPVAPILAGIMAAALCAFEHAGDLAGPPGWPTMSMAANTFPTGAVKFLKQHRPPANMFNSYHFGGYLLYYLGPETKVFIDGRIDTYDPQIWVDDRAIEAGKIPLAEAIRRYGLQTFVLDRRLGYDPGQLARRVSELPDWKTVYMDDVSVVFVHNTPENQAYLRETGAI